MAARTTLEVVYDNFPDLKRRFRRAAERAVQRSADRIAAGAKRRTLRVRTGAMRDGWHVEDHGPLDKQVENTQDYTVFHELGTVHIAPMPMLFPAATEDQPKFLDEMSRVMD